MRRRTILLSAGTGLAGLSGCLGSGDDRQQTDDGGTYSPGAPWTSTEANGLTVGVDRIQMGVVGMPYPDSTAVVNPDRRYLYLTVRGVESQPSRDAFSLQCATQTFDPLAKGDRSFGGNGLHRRWGGAYSADDPDGWLLFELPEAAEATEARLTWPGGEWPLPERARRRLSRPAAPLSVAFDGPATTSGYSVPLTATVTNEGDRPRRFLGALDQTRPLYTPVETYSRLLAGGETATIESAVTLRGVDALRMTTDDGTDRTLTARFTLHWGHGHGEVEVRVPDS